jgi:hypothetical protein
LFQGVIRCLLIGCLVIRCLHGDFRIGGLQPGETKDVRGKIYIVPNDMARLLARYTRDFPEHEKRK